MDINKRGAFTSRDTLIVVDVQVDFCPGGALPIVEGDLVVPVLNQWIDVFQKNGFPVYASRDWHPLSHLSFHDQGGLWPPHCIQDTPGAKFHPDLKLPDDVLIVTKGVRFDQDQNSAFDQTGLAEHLRQKRIQRIWIAGLALEVCVLATAMDGIKEGLEVCLIKKACRPVTVEGGKKAIKKLTLAGVQLID